MGQSVTLGGERLGSGKKMKVGLKGYERSTHDLGYLFRTTASPGTLIPFLDEIALPGDTWDIELNCDVKTHPTIGPLFGTFKIQLDVFVIPVRLYNSLLHNNALNVGRNIAQVKFPQIELISQAGIPEYIPGMSLDNRQINPSCILAYLGIRGTGLSGTAQTRSFNATSWLAYWDIYKNYYANKQEERGAVIHTIPLALVDTVGTVGFNGTNNIPEFPVTSLIALTDGGEFTIDYTTGTAPLPNQIMIQTQYRGWLSLEQLGSRFTDDGVSVLTVLYNFGYYGLDYAIAWRYRTDAEINTVPPRVVTFSLENLDDMRNAILQFYSTTDPFIVNTQDYAPYNFLTQAPTGIGSNLLSSQEGLAVKTYQSDLFNNWLNSEWIDGTGGISDITAIDTSGGSFTIDTLNLSKKIYELLNRVAVSGGTYNDYITTVYDIDRYLHAETPMYMGGLIKELVFQEVISNASTTGDEAQPLGTLGGRGILGSKHKGGRVTIKVDEPSIIMGIWSATPRVDYSQGNRWHTNLQTLDDLHKPQLDEIGFQDLITDQMAWWDTTYQGGQWTYRSAGKQPAWVNYMTNVNRTLGNFAIPENEMFMTLNRRYEWNGAELADLTTYIDPGKFNFIFANTSIDAMNLWVQIAVDAEVRRKMSAKLMPNV